MAKKIAVGIQDFEDIIKNNYYYIDKTSFIKEWWENGDAVTLITRPRRFGKTLNMSMVEQFFSVNYADRGDLFEGLTIWEDEKYRELQGTYPVIFLTFADVKETDFETTAYQIRNIIKNQYEKYSFLQKSDVLSEAEKAFFKEMTFDVKRENMSFSLKQLSEFLSRYYGKKVIILLDEYDTPMQEAYINGYWDELVVFTRSLFNATFKSNPYLERGLMIGITFFKLEKFAKQTSNGSALAETIFSDLNNLVVITTTSNSYATSFGFTEEEVFESLDECGLGSEKEEVKYWYDGFSFGEYMDIYNPWSIINFLNKRKYDAYWANTSSNRLVGKLIREGNKNIKADFEELLRDKSIQCPIDEQIVYNQLDYNETAIWSLLVAGGYLKVLSKERPELSKTGKRPKYELKLTNYEVKSMFINMVHDWFANAEATYGDFITSFLDGDIESMNEYMNKMSMKIFSYFDTGTDTEYSEPERFYHGLVLGLLTELDEEYILRSNRESGLGRYDVIIEPRDKTDESKYAYILEFKVRKRKEKNLEETVENALKQIEDKQYATELVDRGVSADRIRKYGFAFEGKKVLIGEG